MRIVLMIAVLASIGVLHAQSIFNSSNASIITFPTNSSFSKTITLNTEFISESYVANIVGQQYYDNYINISGGDSYGDLSHVYFTFRVPFSNNTAASQGLNSSSDLLGITVTLNASRVIGYIGPKSPVFISVNRTDALSFAERYGFNNATAHVVGLFTNGTLAPFSYYGVAWAVQSRHQSKGSTYQGIYIDANSSNVLGEYEVNAGSQNATDYGVTGNFAIFYLAPLASSSQPDMLYVYAALSVAIIIIAILVLLKQKKR